MTVTVDDTETVVALGATQTFDVAGGQVVVTVNQPSVTESANGRTARGSVAVVTVDVRVGTAAEPLATASVDLLPLRASAVAPAGGIDCEPPAPVLRTPADGSTTTDTTPTFTGTAEPGATVTIRVDGRVIGTTTAGPDGRFTFTPATPLDLGERTATATQTVNGAVSDPSNANDFTITLGPPVLRRPADGSTTTDRTPTFTGTAEPGATVVIRVDGEVVDTTRADADGTFSFTPDTPLDLGDRTATATQTLDGVTSDPSEANDFAIVPEAPELSTPADGSTTTDTTPTFTGTATPGATVVIRVDGEVIGETTAGRDGRFSFTPTTPIEVGERTATATQTVDGVTSGPSDANDFTVDDAEAPAPPVITSPEDGSTTDDTTPTVRGTAEPGATVVIIVDGEPVGEVVADEDGDFRLDLPEALEPGDHEITAVAVDEAGNESDPADPVVITVLGDGSGPTDPGPANPGPTGPGNGPAPYNPGPNTIGSPVTGGPDLLADTGGPDLRLLAAAVVMLAGGTTVLLAGRRRRAA